MFQGRFQGSSTENECVKLQRTNVDYGVASCATCVRIERVKQKDCGNFMSKKSVSPSYPVSVFACGRKVDRSGRGREVCGIQFSKQK